MYYQVTFNGDVDTLTDCFNFAKGMIGKHNPNLIAVRDNMDIFRDDIRGKLGEFAFKEYVNREILNARITGDIDLSVSERGVWDNYDFIINEKNISVKSVKPQSKVLIIECNRFDENGHYAYKNNDKNEIKIDFYVLVRVDISPDITWDDTRTNNVNDFLNPSKLIKNNGNWEKNGTVERKFKAVILGGISHSEFWERKKFIPSGMKLTVNNLNSLLINNCDLNDLPDKVKLDDKKNNILQVDNYAVHKDILIDLSSLIL